MATRPRHRSDKQPNPGTGSRADNNAYVAGNCVFGGLTGTILGAMVVKRFHFEARICPCRVGFIDCKPTAANSALPARAPEPVREAWTPILAIEGWDCAREPLFGIKSTQHIMAMATRVTRQNHNRMIIFPNRSDERLSRL